MLWKWKWFRFLDDEVSSVSTGQRIMAYLIDWFLSSLCLMLPLCLVWMAATHDSSQMEQVNVFRLAQAAGDSKAIAAGLAGLALFVWYLVIVPWKVTPGQTPGKRMMNIAIERKDQAPLRLSDLLIRQGLGLFLLEGALYGGFSMIRDLATLASGLNFTGILLYFSLAVTLVSLLLALLSPSRRMLHDYMAGTRSVRVAPTRADQSI